MFTGGEDRGITAWDTNSGKVAHRIEDAHSTRIKGIVVLKSNAGDVANEDPYLVASGSSDGIIRVWDVRMAVKDNKPNPLAEANTKSRLTCLAGSSLKCKICACVSYPSCHINYSSVHQIFLVSRLSVYHYKLTMCGSLNY